MIASLINIYILQLNLLSTSFLLDKLVSRESLNTLVLNMYPGNKGYSLAFRVVANGQSGAAGNTDGPSGSNSSSAGHSASTSAGSSGSSSRHVSKGNADNSKAYLHLISIE